MDDKYNKILTSTQVSKLINITRQSIYKAIKEKRLNAFKIGRFVLINQEDLDKFVINIELIAGWNKGIFKKSCKRSHLFDEVNTYIRPDGQRVCRTCARENNKIFYRGKRCRLQQQI